MYTLARSILSRGQSGSLQPGNERRHILRTMTAITYYSLLPSLIAIFLSQFQDSDFQLRIKHNETVLLRGLQCAVPPKIMLEQHFGTQSVAYLRAREHVCYPTQKRQSREGPKYQTALGRNITAILLVVAVDDKSL